MRPAALAAAWPLLRVRPALLGATARWSGKLRCVADVAGPAAPHPV